MEALRNYGFLKYFRVLGMKSYICLLDYIIDLWDPNQHHFMVGTRTLAINIEYIYFLIGLSHRGRQVVLSRPWDSDSTLDDLIDRYCSLGMHSQAGKIPIKWLVDRPLSTVVYTIGKFFRTIYSHLTNRAHMLYSI